MELLPSGVLLTQLSVHELFKGDSSVKEVVSKVRKVDKKTRKLSITKLLKHNKPLSRLDCDTRWGSTFLMLESMLLVRDLLD